MTSSAYRLPHTAYSNVLASIFDPLRRALPQLPWILLWIGLAFLIVALVVMICTRWGQSNLLRKCAALSLLAHLLLACYATTVEIVMATGEGRGRSIGVMLIGDPEADGEQPDGDPLSVAGEDEVTKPGAEMPKLLTPPPTVTEHADTSPESLPIAPAVVGASAPKPPLLEAPVPTPAQAETNSATAAVGHDSNLPSPDASASPAQLPEPPVTSDPADWLSGQSSADGNPAPPTPTAAAPAGPDGSTTAGPLVEVAAAPIATHAVPEIYAQRVSDDRSGILRRNGGSPDTEAAVQAALAWLAANQSADGRWDAAHFGAGRELVVLGQNRQGAGAHADTGVTGLALLAFLGAGHTHVRGEYAASVQRGLQFLLTIQGANGNLAGGAEVFAHMYSHGMATLALSEAYAMTGDKRLEEPLKKAIAYTLSAQHPSTGGWRYRPGELGDTSQLGWQLMSLRSAEAAGIEIPPRAKDGATRFLKSVASGHYGGIASYRPAERPSRPMTAEALVCRQFLGMSRDNPAAAEAGDYLLSELPGDQRINLYYWYYATLGMFQLQGEHWARWNQALATTLVHRQRTDGDAAGSWDPDCIWGGYGGRVYSTAVSALCLEVYYRYLPIYRLAKKPASERAKR